MITLEKVGHHTLSVWPFASKMLLDMQTCVKDEKRHLTVNIYVFNVEWRLFTAVNWVVVMTCLYNSSLTLMQVKIYVVSFGLYFRDTWCWIKYTASMWTGSGLTNLTSGLAPGLPISPKLPLQCVSMYPLRHVVYVWSVYVTRSLKASIQLCFIWRRFDRFLSTRNKYIYMTS